MAPRTLWTILLKIIGLYIFLQAFYVLPQLFITITYLSEQHGSLAFGIIAQFLFAISVYLFMIIAFIFRTDWLINALRLNKSITEEKLELNIHRSTVLQIAIIVTGGLLLVDSLPLLLRGLFNYYQDINLYSGFKRYPKGGDVILQLVKVLVSFFMVTSSRLIVNFIERKRKGKVKVESIED
jgi:hypothetical protein